MMLNEIGIITGINEIAGCDHHIGMMHPIDVFQVFQIVFDIGIVDIIAGVGVGEEQLKLAALGIDVIMTAGADMVHQRAWLAVDIHLNPVDAAVAHIGNGKVDHTISAQEGEGSDRTVILKSLYPDVS
jgi:hypothetical protein